MRRKLIGKKAFTQIETLLAISLFAAIALPLLTVFLQSVKTDRAARDVLNANYIAQDYIEKLDTKSYMEALGSVPNRAAAGGYYFSAEITPYGNAESLFSTSCAYAHLIMQSNGSMLAVLPDGKWRLFSSVPSDITFSMSGRQYTLIVSGTSITGTAEYNQCAVIVNAMKKTSGASALTLNSSCQAIIYCRSDNENDIAVNGTGAKHKDIIAAETSLIYVKAAVYESASSGKAIAISEAYINIRNES